MFNLFVTENAGAFDIDESKVPEAAWRNLALRGIKEALKDATAGVPAKVAETGKKEGWDEAKITAETNAQCKAAAEKRLASIYEGNVSEPGANGGGARISPEERIRRAHIAGILVSGGIKPADAEKFAKHPDIIPQLAEKMGMEPEELRKEIDKEVKRQMGIGANLDFTGIKLG